VTNSSPLLYEFGQFQLDAAELMLFCAGKPVRLTLKALNVLLVLVENSGHLVTKEELIRRVWSDAFVEEGNVAQTVSAVRKALGDREHHHQNHEYIETLARRGYRFVAPVKVYSQSGALADDTSRSSSAPNWTDVFASGVRRESDFGKRPEPLHADTQVHHLLLRGRYYWSSYTIDGLKKGIQQFRQAIKIDGNCAPAHIGLADCYYRLSNVSLDPRVAIPKAKKGLLNALKSEENPAHAYSLLGLIHTFHDRHWAVAEREFNRAIDVAPNSALPRKRYGRALGMLGRLDESLSLINQALDIGPVSPDLHVDLGMILHLARMHDEAIEQAELALDTRPDFFTAYVLLGMANIQRKRFLKAVADLERAASLEDSAWVLGWLGHAYAVSRKRRHAARILTLLTERSQRAYVSPYAIALIHIGLGQTEQALQYIEKTYADGNEMWGFVNSSPEFDSLQSEKRFVFLVERNQLRLAR
jgi:DNA-binding winged helix-turn-helix (wHTH) protein/Tfp pilus assembly protein PilF